LPQWLIGTDGSDKVCIWQMLLGALLLLAPGFWLLLASPTSA